MPAFHGSPDGVPEDVATALAQAHREGARMASICTGAFALASAGLLDGRQATTHWRYTDDLARLHPKVEVDADALYVDAGDVITSAGVASGIDLCLHLLRRDHGSAVANAVAREIVAAPHRDGGQAQFIERPPVRPHRTASARPWTGR
ncbi:DJ-1/PfpI family protein [Streptomyces sp. NPDC057257]|uniref:DJ-1/PfpI family protein n=1 Tax=Streptomyces sp. NPDC057257 TaxID=3346071 RepID=UPI00362D749D